MTTSEPAQRRRAHPGLQGDSGPAIAAAIAAALRSTVPLPLTHRPMEVGV